MNRPIQDDRLARFIVEGRPSKAWPPELAGPHRRAGWRLGLWIGLAPRLMAAPVVARDIVRELLRGEIGKARHMLSTIKQEPGNPPYIISRKYRFVWVGNMKAGNTSLTAALFGADPGAEWVTNTGIADVYARYPETKNFFTFAFVRHPFDRAVSYHLQLHGFRRNFTGDQRSRVEEHNREVFARHYGAAEARRFDAWCEWLNTPYGSDEVASPIFRSQHLVIRMGRDRLPDFVGRLENIQADLDRIASLVDMPKPALPMLNTMSGWRTTPEALRAARSKAAVQLTERNKALLRKRYAGDFALGGYS